MPQGGRHRGGTDVPNAGGAPPPDPEQEAFSPAVGPSRPRLLALAVLVASRREAMGAFAIGPVLRIAGWATVALLAGSAAATAAMAFWGGGPRP